MSRKSKSDFTFVEYPGWEDDQYGDYTPDSKVRRRMKRCKLTWSFLAKERAVAIGKLKKNSHI